MPTQFDAPGLPDGTITVPVPASCPELADIYNAPLCAFDHELTYLPMQLGYLPQTGSEILWWIIPAAWFLLAIGAAFILGAFLHAGRKRDQP